MKVREYKEHSFAGIFPLHADDSLIALSDSIKQHGQKEDIVVHENRILDGRRRYAACIRAGVKPKIRKFGSRSTDGTDPLEFVFQVNYHRRDLTDAERTMAAVGYANLKRGYNPPAGELGRKPVSQQQAADKFNTSQKSMERAKNVLDNGTPELQEAMKTEKVSISDAASIAGEHPEVQQAALEAVTSGQATTLQSAVAATRPAPPECPKQIAKEIEPLRIRLARVETVKTEARDLACRGLQTAQMLIAKL